VLPTFDAALDAFDRVIGESRQHRDRVGLFALVYAGVTREVRDRCAAGGFKEAARMERFVAEFATRYFAAHDAWRAGKAAAASWEVALAAAQQWRPVILQHVLLGMNAHINLDLGIVTAELAGGPAGLAPLRHDFDTVNDVLASMVDRSQDLVASASPWMGLVDRFCRGDDEAMIRFSLRRARAAAWDFARRLVELPEDQRPAEIARVDRAVADLGRCVLHPGATSSTALLAVRVREPWRAERALDAMASAAAGPAASPS
jgi:uncharacterized protein DUF5995